MRRATHDNKSIAKWLIISIHALREESDPTWWTGDYIPNISIHALREESDLNELFDGDTTYVISIHALREESDSQRW